jgi:hypothetical protein
LANKCSQSSDFDQFQGLIEPGPMRDVYFHLHLPWPAKITAGMLTPGKLLKFTLVWNALIFDHTLLDGFSSILLIAGECTGPPFSINPNRLYGSSLSSDRLLCCIGREKPL